MAVSPQNLRTCKRDGERQQQCPPAMAAPVIGVSVRGDDHAIFDTVTPEAGGDNMYAPRQPPLESTATPNVPFSVTEAPPVQAATTKPELVEWSAERVDQRLHEGAAAAGWRVVEAWPGGAVHTYPHAPATCMPVLRACLCYMHVCGHASPHGLRRRRRGQAQLEVRLARRRAVHLGAEGPARDESARGRRSTSLALSP